MKRFYSLAVILVIIIGSVTVFSYTYLKPLNLIIESKDYIETKEAKAVKAFIKSRLSRKDGAIYTNYLNSQNRGDETKGHSILSESQGLLMEYAILTEDQDLFDRAYSIVENYMMLDNGLISWRISKDNKISSTSALIDELRIARCLLNAYVKFDKFKYKIDAINLSKSILNNSTYKEMLADFNDGVNISKTLTLCYIDFESFRLLSSINDKWMDISIKSKEVIKNGYLGDNIPLFKKFYDLDTKTYSKENKNELLYSLMVWENLIKNGADPKPINKWMKQQLNKYGCLYTTYNISNNAPFDYVESTSIYAIALRISLKGEDKNLSKKLYSNLMKYHINKGELSKGFGIENTKQAFSFDNLEAMISLLKEIKK